MFNIADEAIALSLSHPFLILLLIFSYSQFYKEKDGYLEQQLLRQGCLYIHDWPNVFVQLIQSIISQKRGLLASLYVITRTSISWLQQASKTKRNYLKKLKDFKVRGEKECTIEGRRRKMEFRELTMHMDAHIMLKPLHSKGALLDKNHAETIVNYIVSIENCQMV